MLYTNRTSNEDSTVIVPYEVWSTIKCRKQTGDLFTVGVHIELLAKYSFADVCWLLLFRSQTKKKTEEWLAVINPDYTNKGQVIMQDLLPVKNDTMNYARFNSGYRGLCINYHTDTTQVWDRFYGIDIYGFDKRFEDK